MNSGIEYNSSTYEEALTNSNKAVEHIDSALSSASSAKGVAASSNVASSFNSALSNLEGVADAVKNVPVTYEGWSDKIVQMNIEQMRAANSMGFYYAIKPTADGYYKVFGLGEPMIVNGECAKYLQEAINKMLSVCPGTYANNGARVGNHTVFGHGTGHAFDILTTLGLRINYNGGGDTAYYAVNNKKTAISSYEVFYVTYDGKMEDLFNEDKLTIKKAYLKIKPGTTIPSDMAKYVVSGLNNVIEVDDVEKSVPSLNNMHTTSMSGQYLDVSKLFASYGFKQVGAFGNPGKNYQGMEWHHFIFDKKLLTQSGTTVSEKPIIIETPLPEPAPSPVIPSTPTPIIPSKPTPSVPTPTVPITPSKPTPSTPTPHPTPAPTPIPVSVNILPENKFSNVIPELKAGNLGAMEISSESVKYDISNINDSDYQSYLSSLSEKGYTLSSDGTYWINGDNKLYVNYSNSNLTINLSNSTYL